MLFWLLKTVKHSITIYCYVSNASYLFHHVGQQHTYISSGKKKNLSSSDFYSLKIGLFSFD